MKPFAARVESSECAEMADKYERVPIRAIRIPTEDWEAAKAVAADRGESLSQVVRDALDRYVKRHK